MAVTVIAVAGAVMAAVKLALRHVLLAVSVALGTVMVAAPAAAQVNVEIAIPGVNIGIYQPVYPELVLVPGYPVYYAPQARANTFFYDGYYWVFHEDRWYMSDWYDGPWDLVDPYSVPLFVLRVPVRYYVNPPVYFNGWILAAPPRWDLHWGPRWVQHRHGWNHWDHRSVPRAAPPPVYQRHYAGERYPRREYQHELRDRHYRYQPRDSVVRQQAQERPLPRTSIPPQPGAQGHSEAPRSQYPQHQRNEVPRYVLTPAPPQVREPVAQEQRHSPRQESERERRIQPAPQTQPAVPSVQVPQLPHNQPREAREERPRPAPVHVAPQSRAPVIFESRQSARLDAGPREPRESRPQQNPRREPQGRGDDRGRGQVERGRGQERGH